MTDFTDKLDALELTLCNQYGSPSVYKQARADAERDRRLTVEHELAQLRAANA